MTKGRERKGRSGPSSALQGFRQRLSDDFYLALVFLFVVLTVGTLGPFVIYRIAIGDFPAAIGISLVILLALGVFAYCWWTGRTAGARRLVVVGMTLASTSLTVAVIHLPYWTFATMVSNFMLVPWRFALPVNALMVLAVLVGAPFFADTHEMVSYLAAMSMVALFSLIFVIVTDFHRDRLSEKVERDPLTGARNRSSLGAHLEQALLGTTKLGQTHTLAFMDLDDFKRVNDLYGHPTGDRVLVDFSRLVMREIRRGDLLYRLGGEEFVLLLSQVDRAGAEVVLSKLHVAVGAGLAVEDGPVTVSIGAAVGRSGQNWPDWLARADEAMYEAKRLGKNRIVYAD